MAVDRINIPSKRYFWAIQRAGMNLETYLRKYPSSAVVQWIEGENMPTLKQLEKFANQVKVPIGYLFLEKEPHEEIPFPVFRGEAGQRQGFDIDVFDTVNSLRQRQEWLAEYLIANDIPSCEIVGVVSLMTPIAETVDLLRGKLQLDARWAFELASDGAAVSKMTEKLEESGVFVAFNGIVGNNTHRPLDVKECRGFALVDKTAPFIFVNSQDAKKAQLFTLVHEVAHIMLGVSAGHAETLTLSHDATERYCDVVAAEFLVPAVVLREIWDSDLKVLSRRFCVSELVIARRAHDLGLMSDFDYRDFWQEYSHRSIIVKKDSNGGDFYRSSLKRVGKLFAIHVNNAVNSRQLSYTEAYRLTGLKGQTYDAFMKNNLL
jgi:Zn-dependent peptidase ImmA (M78 family)